MAVVLLGAALLFYPPCTTVASLCHETLNGSTAGEDGSTALAALQFLGSAQDELGSRHFCASGSTAHQSVTTAYARAVGA